LGDSCRFEEAELYFRGVFGEQGEVDAGTVPGGPERIRPSGHQPQGAFGLPPGKARDWEPWHERESRNYRFRYGAPNAI